MRRIGDFIWIVIAPALLAGALLALDLPMTLPVVPYQDGVTPLYLDRPYANSLSNPALTGQHLVPVPRHLIFDVELELSAPARVTRLLSDEHDRTPFAEWQPDDALRIDVHGRSCTLSRALTLSFPAGRLRLPPGGPVAAAPILVASEGEVHARTLQSWNKLTPAPGLGLVMRNKRKLASLALAYAAWFFSVRRLRRV